LIESDVAAPDDVRAGVQQDLGETDRLRIVQQHDVAGPHQRREIRPVVTHGRLVDLPGPLVERRAVAGGSVQRVMDPLGHPVEVRIALDHDPACVDADAARVGEKRGQHLGHATAHGGRVDVPKDALRQPIPGSESDLHGGVHLLLGHQRAELLERADADADFFEMGHGFSFAWPECLAARQDGLWDHRIMITRVWMSRKTRFSTRLSDALAREPRYDPRSPRTSGA
jgi:hypothetical protein